METIQLLNLSSSQLRRAAEIKERIDQLLAELSNILGGDGESDSTGAAKTTKGAGKKRQMSPEARKRIGDAQKARWARINAAKGKAVPDSAKAKGPGKRRTMSPEAKKKIAEAQKARWAKAQGEKAK